MPMSALILDNVTIIDKNLNYFLDHYLYLHDDKRMSLSTTIFTHLRNFFEEQRILKETMRVKAPDLCAQFQTYEQTEEDIWDIYEHTIQMHVDEPFQEYRQEMERIYNAFQEFIAPAYRQLVEQADGVLDENDQESMLRKVKKDPEVILDVSA